jgi:thiosulfate/3-mercaptopyruvate sulfurtransferase
MFCHLSTLARVGIIAALSLSTACTKSDEQPDVASAVDPKMDSLVSAEWLSEHLNDPDLVVLDCTVMVEQDEDGGFRTVNGRGNYEAGHIPTAAFAGVGDDARVVLYDANNSVWAARVWWMLRWIGFDQAALLDGGLGAWTAEDRPLSTEPSNRPAGTLTVALRPQLIADRDEVLASIEDGSAHLLDSLPAGHYRGEWTMYDRPGHIPGASNVSTTLTVDDTGRYRSPEELAEVFQGDREVRTITYCGGGIAASSNAFLMTRLGFTDVAVYTASLQEWTADPGLPLEVAPELADFGD